MCSIILGQTASGFGMPNSTLARRHCRKFFCLLIEFRAPAIVPRVDKAINKANKSNERGAIASHNALSLMTRRLRARVAAA
jgi:hypothetical protein